MLLAACAMGWGPAGSSPTIWIRMRAAGPPGLSSVATEQRQVYINMMSMNMGELAVVQVKDSKDVATVKAIFQARIDSMVNGGAKVS